MVEARPGPSLDHPWLPDTAWPVLAPFWEALARGSLAFPRCTGCGRFQWYPQAMCPRCRAMDFEWTDVEGTGRVFTFTVVRQAFLPEFADRLPTTVALVEVGAAPGVRLVTNVLTADRRDAAGRVAVGDLVDIEVEEVSPGVFLPFAVLR
ncbi:MAG: Zn-ribbon domain-containing OB-fold protein [Acidimicrobiia bacterium]